MKTPAREAKQSVKKATAAVKKLQESDHLMDQADACAIKVSHKGGTATRTEQQVVDKIIVDNFYAWGFSEEEVKSRRVPAPNGKTCLEQILADRAASKTKTMVSASSTTQACGRSTATPTPHGSA